MFCIDFQFFIFFRSVLLPNNFTRKIGNYNFFIIRLRKRYFNKVVGRIGIQQQCLLRHNFFYSRCMPVDDNGTVAAIDCGINQCLQTIGGQSSVREMQFSQGRGQHLNPMLQQRINVVWLYDKIARLNHKCVMENLYTRYCITCANRQRIAENRRLNEDNGFESEIVAVLKRRPM